MAIHKEAARLALDENNTERRINEIALWRGVIYQALIDASSPCPKLLSGSRRMELVIAKEAATKWLEGEGKDFAEVCEMADLDPDYVRRRARDGLEGMRAKGI